MAIIHVNDASFDTAIRQPGKAVLVDFWAPWCGPCRMIAPILDELSAELGDKVTIAKLNVDENPATAARQQIMGIPTLKLFRDGNVIDTFVGLLPKEHLRKSVVRHLA